jgi:hypothetical protein
LETWKNIRGFKGLYQVSNTGKVKSFKRNKDGKLLNPSVDKDGYLQVTLFNIERHYKKVHRLVGRAFVKGYKPGLEINHKDGIKFNNNDWNLEWNTSSQNKIHAYINKLHVPLKGDRVYNSKVSNKKALTIRSLLQQGCSNKELEKKFNLSRSIISRIKLNQSYV